MVNLIIFNIFLYIAVLLLSLLFIFISKKYITLRLKNYCSLSSNSLEELIILVFIISGIIMFILYLLLAILTPAFLELIINKSGLILMVNDTQDPVRWRPSGTPQTWGILGTTLGVYRLVPGNPRVKTMAALSSRLRGLTIPSTVNFHAVEQMVLID